MHTSCGSTLLHSFPELAVATCSASCPMMAPIHSYYELSGPCTVTSSIEVSARGNDLWLSPCIFCFTSLSTVTQLILLLMIGTGSFWTCQPLVVRYERVCNYDDSSPFHALLIICFVATCGFET